LEQARDVGLVVEAIVEQLDIKRALLRQLEAIVAPDCVLASNTSSISLVNASRTLWGWRAMSAPRAATTQPWPGSSRCSRDR
jgi:hypothetical protein